MSSQALATLYYAHDPMCSWCWGFRPQLLSLKQLLPPTINFVSLVGGLATDSDEPMPQTLQNDIQSTWKRIQQVIPGTQFNFDFWEHNTARRSTYPACRAVITAHIMNNMADEMTFAIQQAYYLNAQNPSDIETLTACAKSLGLDAGEFENLIQSADIQSAFEQELIQTRDLGLYSFPSLVLQLDEELYSIRLDYLSAQTILAEIDRLVTSHSG